MKDEPKEYEKVDAEIKRARFSFVENSAPHDAHIIIDRPELVPQGLRLGDWSQVTK